MFTRILIFIFCLFFTGCASHSYYRNFFNEIEKRNIESAGMKREAVNDFRGAIHVHSFISHDSKGTHEEIIQGAKEAGLDFVFMTDHSSPDIFTEGIEGIHDGITFIRGMEIIKECKGANASECSSVLGLGMKEYIEPGKRRTVDYKKVFENIKQQGGLVFVAHPKGFEDWDIDGISGMEIYDIYDDAVDKKWKYAKFFLEVIYSHDKYPEGVFMNILDRPSGYLAKWDRLLKKGEKITAIAGNDSHQNVKVLGRQLDAYPVSFKLVNTHIIAESKTGDDLMQGLAKGHVFIAFEILGNASGFKFEAAGEDGKIKGIMGDSVTFVSDIKIRAVTPIKSNIRILKNGRIIKEKYGKELEIPANEPGIYRAEADRIINGKIFPWIYSNPIYIERK